jgi:hypothetical protein
MRKVFQNAARIRPAHEDPCNNLRSRCIRPICPFLVEHLRCRVAEEIAMPEPSPQEQIRFLVNIQRLLDEGLLWRYKVALLLALADLRATRPESAPDGNRSEVRGLHSSALSGVHRQAGVVATGRAVIRE